MSEHELSRLYFYSGSVLYLAQFCFGSNPDYSASLPGQDQAGRLRRQRAAPDNQVTAGATPRRRSRAGAGDPRTESLTRLSMNSTNAPGTNVMVVCFLFWSESSQDKVKPMTFYHFGFHYKQMYLCRTHSHLWINYSAPVCTSVTSSAKSQRS